MHTEFWCEYLKGRGNCEDIGVKGMAMLIISFRGIICEGVVWIHLVQVKV
jgi:hypothetical protein